MSETNHFDPREDISHDIAEGQVYEDSRNEDEKRLIHLDDAVALLRYHHNGQMKHTLEPRDAFEENVGSGRFTLVEPTTGSPRMPDDFDEVRSLVRRKHDFYANQSSRTAQHKAEAFAEMYDEIDELVQGNAEPFDFESVRGIGAQTAENLRDSGIVTEMDALRAGEDRLVDIDGMGESNTSNLLETIDDE